jgi:sugar-phosphatase
MAVTTTLFDMDGLLINSEILWHEAEVEIFGELGVGIDRDGTRETKGMYVAEVVQHWYDISPWRSPSRESVVAQILARVGDLVETKGTLMPGALRAIEMAEQRGAVGVASSTPRDLIERCLRHFVLLGRFSAIATAADEPFGKPHPGVFLTAARLLGVDPIQCLVFEDAAAGVLAAKAARMMCVAVPDKDDAGKVEFSLADKVLSSLEELSASWMDAVFG